MQQIQLQSLGEDEDDEGLPAEPESMDADEIAQAAREELEAESELARANKARVERVLLFLLLRIKLYCTKLEPSFIHPLLVDVVGGFG